MNPFWSAYSAWTAMPRMISNGAVDRLAERAKRLWVFFAYAARR